MSVTLEQVLRDIDELTPEERRKVQEALTRLARAERMSEEEELIAAAALRGIHIDPARREMTAEEFDQFEPIAIEGEPLSETIIRERR